MGSLAGASSGFTSRRSSSQEAYSVPEGSRRGHSLPHQPTHAHRCYNPPALTDDAINSCRR